jgi:hypothetical protein
MMFLPHINADGWSLLPDEATDLTLRQDYLDGMLATLTRLREIILMSPLSEVERQALLCELWNIQQHLSEFIHTLVANHLLRTN